MSLLVRNRGAGLIWELEVRPWKLVVGGSRCEVGARMLGAGACEGAGGRAREGLGSYESRAARAYDYDYSLSDQLWLERGRDPCGREAETGKVGWCEGC